MSNMSQVKRVAGNDFDDFVVIALNAYPAFRAETKEDRDRIKKRLMKIEREDPVLSNYGLYRSGKLQGVMRLFDFTMTMFTTKLLAGGVGLVAVDLVHKKEKICKEMIDYFLKHYKKKGACLTALYPFRPDFYRKMGFGYGTKLNQYTVRPADFPPGGSKANVHFLEKKDRKAMVDCYNRFAARTHGMMRKCKYELNMLERDHARFVGYKKGGRIQGYIAFNFKSAKKDNFILNDMHILEFIYENREALMELATFLHSQADQVNHIIYITQDDLFHFFPTDPRNHTDNLMPPVGHESNTQGLGIMYRVIDTKGLFRKLKRHDFGGQSCRLKLSIKDDFFKENAGGCIIDFAEGTPHLRKTGGHDIEIELDIADFSSLIMGAVDFRTLYKYGLAEISNAGYLNTVNKIFLVDQRPVCTTHF
ncbi:MAG: GNAT family N-acetyltransferase, partial [Candidatus Zixiibacteriota bacterium]